MESTSPPLSDNLFNEELIHKKKNFRQKYIKYKTHHMINRLNQLGGVCTTICAKINQMDYILLHGACLDGAMTGYLLRKYCHTDPNKFRFIAPGNYIIQTLEEISNTVTNPKIGLYDLALPDLSNVKCAKGLIVDNIRIDHIIDHHYITEKYKKICPDVVTYEKSASTAGIVFNDMTDNGITVAPSVPPLRVDNGITVAPEDRTVQRTDKGKQRDIKPNNLWILVDVISQGDRGELSLDKTFDKFLLYIGLQKILDMFSLFADSEIVDYVEKYNSFIDVLDFIVQKVPLVYIELIGSIEIISVCNYINHPVWNKNNKKFRPQISCLRGSNANIIDRHTLFVPKRYKTDTVISQVLGKVLPSMGRKINYVVIFNVDSMTNIRLSGRLTIRDVSQNSNLKEGQTGNANTIAGLICPNDYGGHEKAASACINAEYKTNNIDHKICMAYIFDKFYLVQDPVATDLFRFIDEFSYRDPVFFNRLFYGLADEDTIYSAVHNKLKVGVYDQFIYNIIGYGSDHQLVKSTCGSIRVNPTSEINFSSNIFATAFPFPRAYQKAYREPMNEFM